MNNQRRRICMSVTMCICVFYLVYRGVYTLNLDSPFAALFSVTLYLAEIYGNMLMFLYFFQIWNPSLPEPVPPLSDVKVDVYIPTYDEDPELLRGTIVAAMEMDYPHETYVLDDGARDSMKALAEELGAKYIRRDSNIHAKAGNLNHAMELTDGEFIVILDSDHVTERNFITRTLGYFADDKLAFVQTPHAYYNFDSFQGTLDYEKRLYWEEGQLFYNIVQPGKNHWNAASFCGSAAIFRKAALEDVGLIATESITEDMQTGLRLHSRGWRSLYVNERLVSGLAAPDLKTFTIQRLRWGEGNLGTIFYDNPITMPGLSLGQRLNYIALMLSWTTGVQKLILYVTPLLMLLSGVGPVADMSWHLVSITLTYVFAIWYTVKESGDGYGRLIDTEITQMASFWTQCRGTWRAFFNRKNATFVVTKKSGGFKSSGIHDFLLPQYVYIAASAISVTWAASRYFLGVSEDFLGLTICTLLVAMHCFFAWIVIRRALAQRRFGWRHPAATHIHYRLETSEGVQEGEGFSKDLSETGVGFICYEKIRGYNLLVTITAGDTSVTVSGKIRSWEQLAEIESRRKGNINSYRYGVEFENLNKDQKRDLWHLCTKYAVARRYHDFDPKRKSGIMDCVKEEKDSGMKLPVRMFRPDMGDVCAITESVSNTAYTVLTGESFSSKDCVRASISTPTGEITGNARRTKSEQIELGQLNLWAHRFVFDAFDGQSRGKLTTLMHVSHEPKMRELTTLQPKRTRIPTFIPFSIVGGITVLAACITIMATLFLCKDEVLMARAILEKPVDATGQVRLQELVKLFEKAPTVNERHFLRLRKAMQTLGHQDSIERLNQALVDSEFRSPAARLQQAYALEKMGRSEEAKSAFTNLLMNMEQFNNRRTRANLILAAARNSANMKQYDRAVKLYEIVWKEQLHSLDIRAEFAGILTASGKHQRAFQVLTSSDMTNEDRFLLASIHVAMDQLPAAKKVLVSLASENSDLRVRKNIADIDAWMENYEDAITSYEAILSEYPDDLDTKIALTRTLVWDKQFRDALVRGESLRSELTIENQLLVWKPMLEAISELPFVQPPDQAFVMMAFSQRAQFEKDTEFFENLAQAVIHSFEPDRAASLVEQLVAMQPESRELKTAFARVLYHMGDFKAAAEHYEQLISAGALPSDLKEQGEVWLAAALNSRRRGALQESSDRYDAALKCFLQLMHEDHRDTEVWLPFLDSVAGAESHSDSVVNAVIEIFNTRVVAAADRTVTTRLADALSRIGQDTFALQVLDDLLADQSDVVTRWRRANVLLRLNRNAEAETIYTDLLNADAFANNEESQVGLLLAAASNSAVLGNAEASNLRYSQALEKLRQKIDSAPEQTSAWVPFVSACAGLQKVASADLAIVKKIYQQRGQLIENLEFVERLCDVLLAAKEFDSALPLLKTLMENRSSSRALRFRYAQALQAVGRFSDAERQFQVLLAPKKRVANPHVAQRLTSADLRIEEDTILLGAAQNAAAQGKSEYAASLNRKALVLMRPKVEDQIDSTENWLPYLAALHGSGTITPVDRQLVSEICDLRDVHAEDPRFFAKLAEVLIAIGQQRTAIAIVERACSRFHDDEGLRAVMARALTNAGNHEQAAQYFNWLLTAVDTNNPIPRSRLLLEAAENSRKREAFAEAEARSNEAFKVLSEVVSADPARETLWQPYLDAAAAATKLSLADRRVALHLFKSWHQRSDDLQFLERLTDVLIRCGYPRRGRTLLEHAEDRSEPAQFRLAMLLSDLGEYDRAETRFRSLLHSEVFRSDARKSIDLLLASAQNASRLNDSVSAEARYSAALRLLRAQLSDGVFAKMLSMRFLDAIAGADSVSDDDLQIVKGIQQHWAASDDIAFCSRLADVLLKLQQPHDALPILKSLEQRDPTSAQHQLRLANTLQALGKQADAEKRYAELIHSGSLSADPAMHQSLFASAARNSLSMKDYETARMRFEELFELDVDRVQFDVEYAICLQHTGKLQDAIQLLATKGGSSVDSTQHQQLLASMYLAADDFSSARRTYAQILNNEPQDFSARRGIALIEFWTKRYDTAIVRFRELLSEHPGDLELKESLASALLWNGEYQSAMSELAKLFRRGRPTGRLSVQFLQAAAASSILTKSQTEIVTQIEVALAADGFSPEEVNDVRSHLADVYVAHSEPNKAVAIFESIASTDGGTETKTKYAMALVAANRSQQAVSILEELMESRESLSSEAGGLSAAESSKQLNDLRLCLAYSYYQLGDFEKADQEFSTLLSGASTFEPTERARLLLASANSSEQLGNIADSISRYDEALHLLTERCNKDARNTSLWQPFLNAAAGSRNWPAESEGVVQRIFANRASHEATSDFLFRLADVLTRVSKHRDALRLLREISRDRSNELQIQRRMADCYLTLKDYREAIPLLRRLVRDEPTDELRALQLADVLHTTGQFAEADSLYSDLLLASQASPIQQQTRVLLNAARNSVALGQLEQGRDRFERRREMLSDRDETDIEYAGLLLQLGDPAQAIELLSGHTLETSQKHVLAGAYEAIGDRESARGVYRRISIESPSDIKAIGGLARIAMGLGDFESAIEKLDVLLAQSPGDTKIRFDKASAHLGASQFAAAAKLFFELVNEQPNEHKYWLPFAQSTAGVADPTDYLTQVNRIRSAVLLGDSPVFGQADRIELATRFADIYLKVRQFEVVLEVTQTHASLGSSLPHDQLATRRAHALLSLDRAEEAIPIYERCVAAEPNNLDARYLLAIALKKAKQSQQAMLHFDRLVAHASPSSEWLLAAAENAHDLGQTQKSAALHKRAEEGIRAAFRAEPSSVAVWSQVVRNVNLVANPSEFERQSVSKIYAQSKRVKLDADFRAQLAYALMKTESFAEARDMYRQVLKANPQSSDARFNLAVLLIRQGDYAAAQRHFDHLISNDRFAKDDRRRADLLLAAASNLVRLERQLDAFPFYDQALIRMGRVVRLEPQNSDDWQAYLDAAAGVESIPASHRSTVMSIYANRKSHRDANGSPSPHSRGILTLSSESTSIDSTIRTRNEPFDDLSNAATETASSRGKAFHERLADVLIRLGSYREALDVLRDIEEKDHGVLYRLAITLTNLEMDSDADRMFQTLLAEDAFHDFKQRRAELLLVAASNSARRGASDEASERYLRALPLWRELFHDQPENIHFWPRYLDAAAGTKKLADIDVDITLAIFDRFRPHESLWKEISFMTRLIDVMIRIEEPTKSLPVSRELFAQNSRNDEVRLRLANNLHAVSLFEEADPHYDFLIDNQAFAKDEQTRGQMMVTAARNNATLGDFAKSRRIFEQLWQLGLSSRDYEVEYAVILAKTGYEAEGQRLLRQSPLNLDQQYRLASMYTSAQELANADEVYQQILAKQPEEIVARRRRSELLVWLKQYDKAIVMLEDLLRDNPDDAGLLELLATAQLWSGDHYQALQRLRDLLTKDPQNRALLIPYLQSLAAFPEGLSPIDARNVADIAADYSNIDRKLAYPSRTDLGTALARPLVKLGRGDEAIAMLNELLVDTKQPISIRATLADVYMLTRDYGSAIEHYETLLRDGAVSQQYKIQLAYAHHELGHYATAAKYFDVIVGDPAWRRESLENQFGFVLSGAYNSRKLNRLAEANERYQTVLGVVLKQWRTDPSDSSYWVPLLSAAQGASASETPASPELKQAIRYIYVQRNSFSRADSAAKRGLWMQLANAMQQQGDVDSGKALLYELLKNNADDVGARVRLAKLLQSEGDDKEAVVHFELALNNYDALARHSESGERYERVVSRARSNGLASNEVSLSRAALNGVSSKNNPPSIEMADAADLWLSAADSFKRVDRASDATALYRRAADSLRYEFANDPTNSMQRGSLVLMYLRALNGVGHLTAEDATQLDAIYLTDWKAMADENFVSQFGNALALADRDEEAMELVQMLPDSEPWKYWRLATLASRRGQYDLAMQHYERILHSGRFTKRDSQYYELLLAIGNLHRLMGDNDQSQVMYSQATEHYRQIASQRDATVEQWRSYLTSLRGLNVLTAADEKMMQRALTTLRYDDPRLSEVLAELSLRWGTTNETEKFVARAVRQYPESSALQLVQARLLLKLKRYDDASELLLRLESLDEFTINAARRSDLALMQAELFVATEKFKQARDIYDEIGVDYAPRTDYALVLARLGNIDQAVEVLVSQDSLTKDERALLASFHIEKRDYHLARQIYEQMLVDDPHDVKLQRSLANVHFWSRDYDTAIRAYEALIGLFPDDVELRDSYGKSLLWIGRYDDAIVVLTKLLSEDPSRTDLWLPTLDAIAGSENVSLEDPTLRMIEKGFLKHQDSMDLAERLARIYLRAGEPILARERLLPYIKSGDATPTLRLQYADILAELGRFGEAIRVYRNYFELDGLEHTDAQTTENRLRFADVLHRAEFYKEAQREFEWVLQRADGSTPARYRHALLSSARNLVALNRTEEALQRFDALRQLDPGVFSLHEEYAGALLAAGRPNQALATLQRTKRLTLDGHYLLGAIYTNLKNYRAASELYRRIISSEPNELRAWRELADVSTWGKDYRTAIYIYKRLLKMSPDSEPLRLGLAHAYLWNGQHQAALDLLVDVIDQSTDRHDLWASFVLAAAGENVQVSPKARKLLSRIVSSRRSWPQDLAFRESIMEAMFRLGERDAALSLLAEVVKAKPGDRDVRRRLADELHAMGRYREAEHHYELLLNRPTTLRGEQYAPVLRTPAASRYISIELPPGNVGTEQRLGN